MPTEDKINAKYLALHNALGTRKDALDAEAFDIAHGKIWADCDVELKTRKEKLKAKSSRTDDENKELSTLKSLVI